MAGAAASRAVLMAPVVALTLALVVAGGTWWLDDERRVSDGVWWAVLALLALTVLLLVVVLALLAAAALPRTADAGAGTALFAATVVLAVAGLAAGASGIVYAIGFEARDDTAKTAAPDDSLSKLAVTLAPRVWSHPAERFGPLDPSMFLRSASLRWRRPGADPVIRPRRVRPASLGGACQPAACARFGPFLATQLTRPHLKRARRPRRLPTSRGIYLEGADDLRRGQLVHDPPVPAFFRTDEAKPAEITYWMFFGASRRRARPPRRTREGDWERVTIRLDDKKKPAWLVLPSSERPVAWEDVRRTKDGHPVLFAALGRHALFVGACRSPRTSETCREDPRARGLRWDTWRDARDVTVQPWYGFGGAWGHAGRRSGLTGPLGPRP